MITVDVIFMSKIVVPEFEIVPSELDQVSGLDYRIVFENGRPEGFAQLVLGTVGDYCESNSLVAQKLPELGLDPRDVLVNLHRFHPNGRDLDPDDPEHRKLMKKGVGTAVLDKLIEAALERDARVMHAFTTHSPKRIPMRNFLEKNGFSPYESGMTMYYKML